MKEKLKKSKLLRALIIILVIVLLIWLGLHAMVSKLKQVADAYDSGQEKVTLERRTLTESVSATGSITSVESKSVVANVTGVEILEVNVEVGDVVQAGDVIALLDSTDLEENLTTAETALSVADSQSNLSITSAQRTLTNAEETRNIQLERADANVASAWKDYADAASTMTTDKNNYDNATTNVNGTKTAYENEQKTLAELNNQLTELNNQLAAAQSELAALQTPAPEVTTAPVATQAPEATQAPTEGEAEQAEESGEAPIVTPAATPSAEVTALEEKIAALNTQIAELNAKITAQTGTVSTAQTNYENALKTQAERKTEYEKQKATTEQLLNTYTSMVQTKEDTDRSTESSINTAKDSLTSSKLSSQTADSSYKQQIRNYEKQIDACTVTAPISGVVTAVSAEKGSTYAGTAIVTIEDTSSYEITAQIPEYDIGNIEVGQKVEITTNGTGDTKFTGTVKSIAPRATTGSSSVTYKVVITLDSMDDRLKLDMTAKLSIILDSKEDVFAVPYDCVQVDDQGNDYIELYSEDAEENERIYVTMGLESDYYVEISGDGLTEGMTVIVPLTEDDIDFLLEGI